MVRAITAAVLGWETSRIKVTPAEIGGGFSGKTTVYLEPVARLSEGRPSVKLVMSREEVLRSSGPAPGAKLRIKIGATSDGELTAIDGWMAYQVGAYGDLAWSVRCRWRRQVPQPQARVVGRALQHAEDRRYPRRRPRTPPLPLSRSSTTSQASSAWIRSNCDSRMPQSRVTSRRWACPSAYRPRRGLEALKASDHYQSEPVEGAARGVAVGFWFNIGEQSSATVNLNEDGTATVITGSPDIGGSRASMASWPPRSWGSRLLDHSGRRRHRPSDSPTSRRAPRHLCHRQGGRRGLPRAQGRAVPSRCADHGG